MGTDDMRKILLPKLLSVVSISEVFAMLRKEGKSKKIVLDFAELDDCDQSGLYFLKYIEENYPNVGFANVDEQVELLLESCSPVKSPEVSPRTRISISRQQEILADKFLNFAQKVRTFLSLLADEIYHTFQYLRTHYHGSLHRPVWHQPETHGLVNGKS